MFAIILPPLISTGNNMVQWCTCILFNTWSILMIQHLTTQLNSSFHYIYVKIESVFDYNYNSFYVNVIISYPPSHTHMYSRVQGNIIQPLLLFLRPVKGICGFSRESVIAITTNIESIEFRRRQNHYLGFEEHPRAGTSDDVEAVFALFHRFLGNIFTLKEFKACWRKVVR